MSEKYRIEFNFDLSMAGLDSYYPGGRNNRKAAYDEIGRYFYKLDFDHVLHSTYASKLPYSNGEIELLIENFFESVKWAENCMKTCHVTIVDESVIDALKVREETKVLGMEDMLKDISAEKRKETLDFQIQYCKKRISRNKKELNDYQRILNKLDNMR